jgi:hypothetical protein
MVIKEYRLPGPGIFGQKSAQLATSQHTDEGEQCEIAILERTLQLSANSWAEDQRDANELGFCAGGVVWVDPSSIMLGCSSVTRAIVPDRDAVAVRGLDRLSWAWFVAGFIPTSHLFSIDDGEYPHQRASRLGLGSGFPHDCGRHESLWSTILSFINTSTTGKNGALSDGNS